MLMYNSIEYSKNYSKTSGSLSTITDSETFKFKAKITEINLAAGNAKDFGIAVPLKYFINFWGNLEILLMNCGVNVTLTLSVKSVITNSTGAVTFKITKPYFSLMTLSTQNNIKLM